MNRLQQSCLHGFMIVNILIGEFWYALAIQICSLNLPLKVFDFVNYCFHTTETNGLLLQINLQNWFNSQNSIKYVLQFISCKVLWRSTDYPNTELVMHNNILYYIFKIKWKIFYMFKDNCHNVYSVFKSNKR